MRIAVIGHVEHITLGRVPAVPRTGEIAHLESPRWFPGGGGGVAFFQLTRCPTELLLYTALGNDEAARHVEQRLSRTAAHVYAARRGEAHTRDLVMITPEGERTIVVVGEPLHPSRSDPLPWEELASCDAAYFTAQDPASLREARAARSLLVSARRRASLDASGVRADVVVGSALDAREACTLADFAVTPSALILTEGAAGGSVHTESGIRRFRAPPSPPAGGGSYGAGDSFAGALTWYVACGVPLLDACQLAGRHGAAVLGALDPLEAQIAPTTAPAPRG
jgi:ribokinase